MESPFTDFTAPVRELYDYTQNELMFENPLLDPDRMEVEKNYETQKPVSYEELTKEDREIVDIEKAVRLNKKYEKELWGNHIESIRKYFSSISIAKDVHPSAAADFASAVAKWQGTVFQNKKSADGVLGPVSWNLLKSRISAVPVPTPAPTITRSRWHSIITNTVSSPAIPLVHGKETFKQMVAAIKTATSSDHYIYILGWMLDVDFEMIPGDKSSTLIQLLQDASKRNVEIRVLIWDSPLYIKGISNAATKINSLTNAVLIKDNATFGSPGIKSAISKIRFLLSQAPLFLRFISVWNDFVAKANTIQNEGSHHEKVLLVKGKEGLIGFCGGIDINPNRVKGVDSLGRSTVLHDIHCELRGHAAWVLLHRFIWRWQVYKSRASLPTPKLLSAPLLGEKEPLPAAALPGANVAHVKILQTYNHPGSNIKDRSIREAVKLAIFNAKKSVHIEDQYMISLEIASWLNNKLANEPNFSSVTILTQDDDIAGEDILFPKQMRKKFIDELVNGLSAANKKKIFIQMLHRSAPLTAHHKIHSKIYIIDDELAIIGSANLSSRSMTHDSETAAIIFNDTGAATNFASQLKTKIKADPDTNIISYAPNANVKDIDVKVIDELNNLSVAKRIALSAAGPAIGLLIPQVIKTLVTQLKPALIDIIDPDADNTQPQQELEGWPESLQEDSMYNEREEQEAGMEELFLPATDESLENYQSGDYQQSEDETNAYPDQFEHGAEDLTFSNEQTTYLNESIEEISNGYFPAEKETAEVIENQVAIAKAPAVNSKACEGLICWAKDALNKFLNVNLKVNNLVDEATKKAIGDFQLKNNLQQTRTIDSVTERALLEADAIQKQGTIAANIITEAKTRIEDWTKGGLEGVKEKPQHILNSFRDPRQLWAFVLHHMAFKRKGRKSGQYSDPSSYLKTGAHFCIMLDGRIIQLHPLSRMIWHGNCLSPRSVAVEFEGNFPSIKGKWWYPTEKKTGKKIKINEDKPTRVQYDSGKFLSGYLKIVLGTTHIFAHRQSSDSRENDPGPDIWYNVGQWSIDNLGMTDGGPTFKCGSGNPILPEWRSWGNKTTAVNESENYEITDETEMEDYDNYEEETKRSYTRYSQNLANIFLTITAEKQGQIKGTILQKGKEGMIAVYAFHHEIISPRDTASGLATGKRVHKPITITKEVDMSSAKLLSALVSNERLKKVGINFWKPGSMGKPGGGAFEINYYRITLTNAFISNISQDRPATAGMNAPVWERVELVYEKIEWEYLEGSQLTAGDDWRRMSELEFHEAIEEAASEENEMMDEWEWEDQNNEEINELNDYEMIENDVPQVRSSRNVRGCETRICWAKTVLNRELDLSLAINDTMNVETRQAIENFQLNNSLPQTRRIDAATERALLEADALRRNNVTIGQLSARNVISEAKIKIEDWTRQAVNTRPQLIRDYYRDPRKINDFVLHQMAFKRQGRINRQSFSDPASYLKTPAHFCIMLDGRIIQLHPMSRVIYHAQGISPKSVAVEFAGNFPNTRGVWGVSRNSTLQNRDYPTQAQFDSGRFLTGYLKIVLGTTRILAHRQSHASRENDPGPDIWYNVGQWAVDNLGLTDGGPTFKKGSGNPILPEWRTWGNRTGSPINNEYDAMTQEVDREEDESMELEADTEELANDELKYNEFEGEDVSEQNDLFYEMDDLVNDLSNSIRQNSYYANKLGWIQYYDQINNLLLPFSGLQNVSLGEEAFSEAVASWQRQQGITADGIIGPDTWNRIRPLIILPNPSRSTTINPPTITAPSPPSGLFGILIIDTSVPPLSASNPIYRFTPDDALWLARFVEGEAGGHDNPDSHAVMWAMFNRFGILRHRVTAWTSFAVFLRAYSTTLQPLLKSSGAAQRAWDNYRRDPVRNDIVSSEDTYPGTSIRRVQYVRHIRLQQKVWNDFPQYVRTMVTNILNGLIPNPGIGIATDFASTNIFLLTYRRRLGLSTIISTEDWRQYTLEYARNKNKIWIGEKPNLDQRKNAFFIDRRFIAVPPNAVKVEMPIQPETGT